MRFRLSALARADLAAIVSTSDERWGEAARRRYTAQVRSAMLKVAADPHGVMTRDRSDLAPTIRSFHIRHARSLDRAVRVQEPVHVLFYRPIQPGLIEIVRVLHERMEPSRHIGTAS